jgi:hypothetical protein
VGKVEEDRVLVELMLSIALSPLLSENLSAAEVNTLDRIDITVRHHDVALRLGSAATNGAPRGPALGPRSACGRLQDTV